jgi:hypothetical protein
VRRGGRRRRSIGRGDAAVWCLAGRWGPRRTRTHECYSVLRAEDLYTALLKSDPVNVRAGAAGTATYSIEDRKHTASWELRTNRVWRGGRLFLRCPRCHRRCTRLYVPLVTSSLACRVCWGLSYASRALRNYKDSLWGRGAFARVFGTTQRDWAYDAACEARSERRARSLQRVAERRRLWRPVVA